MSDFGKATPISHGRQYNFSESEKAQYLKKYPHIAPEVVHDEIKQTTLTVTRLISCLNESFLRFHYIVQKDSTKMHGEDRNQKYTALSECGDACSE